MTSRRVATGYVIAIMLGIWSVPVPGSAADYWMAGVDPVDQLLFHRSGPLDYMGLFKPNAPWKTVASRLTALQISPEIVVRGTDDQLKTIFADLERRHIALGVTIGVLVRSDTCGQDTEGFGAPRGVEAMARRIKSLGGRLDYLNMDEPVTWGHVKQGKNAAGYYFCASSVAEIAATAASKIAVLQGTFPDMQVGQTDAVNSRYPTLARDILAFDEQLQQRFGVKLAYMHTDVAWNSNWQPQLEQLAAGLHARGIKLGVICDGDPKAPSDQAWVTLALQHCRAAADDPRIAPSQFVIQTWSPLPSRMLPETQPGTLSYEGKQAIAMFH
jgi:hypothetical protein